MLITFLYMITIFRSNHLISRSSTQKQTSNTNPRMRSFTLLVIRSLLILILHASLSSAARHLLSCDPSGTINGSDPPPDKCNSENSSGCCKAGETYTTYTCSPPLSGSTSAILTINSFQEGGDGGGPSECDNQYHSDDTPVVALSTGWYSGGSRCLKNVIISGNGRSVTAMVVDECDSTMGCDEEHAYQPPCRNNIVDASKAVWEALGVSEGEWGEMDITWSDA